MQRMELIMVRVSELAYKKHYAYAPAKCSRVAGTLNTLRFFET